LEEPACILPELDQILVLSTGIRGSSSDDVVADCLVDLFYVSDGKIEMPIHQIEPHGKDENG
jgi:hypothetical protein